MADIRVLEFDHHDGTTKAADVSVLARSGYPLSRVEAEVLKCDVRCANCHRIRTHEQRGWWGARLFALPGNNDSSDLIRPSGGEESAPGGGIGTEESRD